MDIVRLLQICLSGLILTGLSSQARAACNPDAALNNLLNSPQSIEAALNHAECAVDEGNFESAIATYEALLIYAPSNAPLELDLAALYAGLGAVELARLHYENVLESAGLSPELRIRAQTGLAGLTRTDNESFRFSHYAAWRWQDNANLGLSSAAVSVGSSVVSVPSNQQEKSDKSMWHEGGLQTRFGSSDEINAWELNLDWFGNWQDKGKSLNSVLVNGEFGPELSLGEPV